MSYASSFILLNYGYNQQMKILITGCQGFVGKSLAEYALNSGHQVLGVDRFTPEETCQAMQYSQCNLHQQEFVDLINFFAPDAIFHAAGSASVANSFSFPHEDFLMAVGTWAAVLDAVRKSEMNPLVMFPSSASVYGNPSILPIPENADLQPISPYGFHKVISEKLAQEYCQCFGLNVVVVRLFSTIGPYQQRLLVWELFQQSVNKSNSLTIQGTGDETRDFLHINDISHYFLCLMDIQPQGFLPINVASGKATSVMEIANIILQITENHHPVITLNKDLKGDPKIWQADNTLLQEMVPFTPIAIAEGITDCVKYWLSTQDNS
jgi:UDP-glucose 4-epimerase